MGIFRFLEGAMFVDEHLKVTECVGTRRVEGIEDEAVLQHIFHPAGYVSAVSEGQTLVGKDRRHQGIVIGHAHRE